MSTDPELKSVAFVANYVDAHRGEFTQRAEQIQQLERLAKEYKLQYSTTYPDTAARDRKRSYFEQHDGASLHETISSVVSNDSLKESQYGSADSDQAVLNFFQFGSDIFSEAYFGKIYGVLVGMAQVVASTRNIPKRRRTTIKPNMQSATDHGILEDSTRAQAEEHTADQSREGARDHNQPAFEVVEATINRVPPSKMEDSEQPQQQGGITAGNDELVDDNEDQSPRAGQVSRGKVTHANTGGEHDESADQALLTIGFSDIIREINSSIGIAVTELLAKAADNQAAHINLKPAQGLQILYKTAFGKDWQTDTVLMATRSQLTTADSVRSLIWAFIVGEDFNGEPALPGSLQRLRKRGEALHRYLTPVLAERGLDFDEIYSRALINQYEDPGFAESTIQPAAYDLANQTCMILNGHIGLLHKSFIHDD